MVVTVIDEITRTTKPLKRLNIGKFYSLNHAYGFGGKGFCNAEAMNSVIPVSAPP